MSRSLDGDDGTKAGRNNPCPCGSGRKFKLCCGAAGAAATPLASIEQLGQKAASAYNAGRLNEAAALTAQILSRQPRDYHATFLTGMIARRTGNPAQAEQSLRQAVSLHKGSAEAHLQLANLLRETGRSSEAVFAYQTAIRLKPNEAAAHNDLGLVYLSEQRWVEAAECFERATAIKSDFAVAHYNLGIALQSQGRDWDAIAALRRAAAAAPGLAEAHNRLGNLLHANGYHAEALAAFRNAAAARPGSTLAGLNLAKIFIQEQKPAAADQCLHETIARDPKSSEAHRMLGMVQKQLGHFDDAITSLERSIALDPRQITAYHDLIYSKKITESDRPLIDRMAALVGQSGLDRRDRTSLHFALGKAFDDLAAYDQAIQHFDAANRLERSRFAFDRAKLKAEIDQTIATFTPDFFARHASAASHSEMPVFVLGMMRSGTTLVEQILSSHPEVSGGGELAFWGDAATMLTRVGLNSLDPPVTRKLAGDYGAVLARISPTARRVTDKMPHNFLWIGPIHTVFPRARIIHCRRNPVDTCLSIYVSYFGVAKDFAYDRGDIVFFYEQYLRLMAHWRSVLPADRFLEVDYEELVAARERVTRQMIDFCSLDWSDACLHHEANERAVTTVSMWQARQPVYKTSVERWRRYEPWLGELRRLITETERKGEA